MVFVFHIVNGRGQVDAVVGISGDDNVGGEGSTVGLVHRDTGPEVFQVDDFINFAGENKREVLFTATELVGVDGVEREFAAVEAVCIVAVNERVSVVVNPVCTGIFVHHNGLACTVIGTGHSNRTLTNFVVPVVVQHEVGWQRDLLCETKSVGLEFVQWQTCGITYHNRGAGHVGVLRLHLIANKFTFLNLRTPC